MQIIHESQTLSNPIFFQGSLETINAFPGLIAEENWFPTKINGVYPFESTFTFHGPFAYRYIRVTVVPKNKGRQDCEVDCCLSGMESIAGLPSWKEISTTELHKSEVWQGGKVFFSFFSYFSLLFFFFLGRVTRCFLRGAINQKCCSCKSLPCD